MIMAIWLWQLAERNNSHRLTKAVAATVFIAAIAYPCAKLEGNDQTKWQDYSPERFTELRQSGKAVFIYLSADCCITCLVNERVAMGDKFYASLKSNNVTYLKGDWTFKDPQITKLLNQYNRNGVPLYLLFSSNSQDAQVLPQILTESLLLDKINQL